MATQFGRILSLSGGLYTVRTPEETILCFAKGAFRRGETSPVAGDLVEISLEEPIGQKQRQMGARGLITRVLERKNVLIRPPLANLDTLFLVVAVREPEPVLLSVDKLLSIARHNGIEAVLVFTKKELDPKRAEELVSLYRRAGFSAFAVSNLEKEEAKALLYPCIRGQVCAMAGASGVGKSTLINGLFPELRQETGLLSEKTQRGKHTTRQSTLFDISSRLGKEDPVYVADTPGFSLLDFERFFFMEKDDLVFTFPEFSPYLGSCRYTKCSHRTEDGCRILEGVQAGEIAPSRHESYVTLYEELAKTPSWDMGKKKTRR
ncbi:MAG: ribosome small subunit-dependent GTPase A [Clostridia bacterium]|nr:ribosome small subunit-dependent GTPase A [Clostridia bacterium]